VRGRFTFETSDALKGITPADVELSPVPVDFDTSPPPADVAVANIRSDWTFEMQGLNGTRRLQVLRLPVEWAFKTTRVNGIDVTDRPLPFGRKQQSLTDVDVHLTDRITESNGMITDDTGRQLPGATVIVFSTDRTLWYFASRFVRKATAGRRGEFRVTGLPAGSYYAVALSQKVSGHDDGEWQVPESLDSFVSRASIIGLRDGENVTVNLSVHIH
jgi:hypothetical protein